MYVRLLLACVALALAAPGHAADKKYGECQAAAKELNACRDGAIYGCLKPC
jgi:hypothetical protein